LVNAPLKLVELYNPLISGLDRANNHMKNILEMMQSVRLAHRGIFDRYFAQYPPQCSEMTFTNIFCWAEIKNHRFCEYRDHLIVSYQRESESEPRFFPPIGEHPEYLMLEPLPGLRAYNWVRIPKVLSEHLPQTPSLVFDRDNSDYYYRVEELRTLNGKKFHGKRNFIRSFAELNPTVRALEARDAGACIELQERWLIQQGRGEKSAEEETVAVKAALRHFGALQITGIVVELDGNLVGFAIGERLNSETFVEHHEKADRGFRGAYQYILHTLAKTIAEGSTFLNRGQDLGVPGLRKAKLSWQPAGLVRKYTLQACL
jgi:hypothetical protein